MKNVKFLNFNFEKYQKGAKAFMLKAINFKEKLKSFTKKADKIISQS